MCLLVETHTCRKGKLQNHTTAYECCQQAGSKHVPSCKSLELPQYALDPGLLVVHITEKLMQTVGLIQLCTAGSCHTLDPLKASINSLTFILHLGCIKSTAGHQTVSLTVQVFQTILETWVKRCVNNIIALFLYQQNHRNLTYLAELQFLRKHVSTSVRLQHALKWYLHNLLITQSYVPKQKVKAIPHEQIYQLPVAGASSEGC